MKKLLLILFISPIFCFAKSIDMDNLKCGNLQIYSDTTLSQILDNCNIYKTFTRKRGNSLNLEKKDWEKQKTLYEVQFYASSQKQLVRCNFLNNDPNAIVIGCR